MCFTTNRLFSRLKNVKIYATKKTRDIMFKLHSEYKPTGDQPEAIR